MHIRTSVIAGCTLAALASLPAGAAELTGTLKKIKESGVIVLGNRDSSIPFSYYDNNQKPIGYSVDLANKVVDEVKKELKMPNLQVRYNLVTSQTRIPLVQNGTVDLECGSTTNNAERGKQVAFSVGIFEIGTRLLTAKTSGIKDFPDLKGKNVVTTAGTTSERLIKAMNASKNLGMNVISAKDHGESFLMLESGRAAAFMMDDALLYGEMAKAKNPANWTVTGKSQSYEIYGCMLRKDDPAFKKVVDTALTNTFKSGEINKIYAKWFTSPVPPKGLNLNFPMSDELKALLAKPTDKPAE
ncbi:glutamate/aspartate ABC transporter substrate-binding protein [Chromobacterium amazonense]|uniref:Amino acid ABC transporter substrate-binding protein n=1 Tax=Chromobacterium amazonense TaxID=1382803 RepID=A0A1S1WVG4_9NEIS|nr:glutamate/aspartate ABC transporter substrate-binding protein [Chromobacterium amazonense]MBM2885887.1 glutamate/aspartate ABC transporter substrate-binding protein [Chromobacterium amazonense]MDE1713770.1 glutamate/aspartate ABC transporter substrate-binding protein [Chromobacterium amazonense]OHX11130.1 ABC transporter [Chromobacterium amazonense]PRP72543.1 amino acid ABC transporter substrate-binding protein [Chromobacterium amazonense]